MELYNPSIISFGQLPIELVEIILTFTPYQSIPEAIRVCKFWNQVLDKKAKYIKQYITNLSRINMWSKPLYSRNIELHFEFVPGIYNNIDSPNIWSSTEKNIYSIFESDFVKKISLKNIIETIRPKKKLSYVTSGSIKLYLDNQYTATLNVFSISEYQQSLYYRDINRYTILE